jgi:MFS family permease
MNVKRYVMAALAAFVFLQAFEFLWHGLLLHDLYYEPTKQLWRPESEMGAFFPVAVAVGLLFAAVVAFIFTRHYENRGPGEGLRFGLYIGLLIGLVMFGFYPYLPIPLGLAVLWFVGGVIEGVGMGLVLALVYRAESSRPAAGA